MYVADPIPLSPSQTLSAYASPAEIEQATQALAQALQASAAERGRVAIAVAEAKAVAQRARTHPA
jgi:chorismate mutase